MHSNVYIYFQISNSRLVQSMARVFNTIAVIHSSIFFFNFYKLNLLSIKINLLVQRTDPSHVTNWWKTENPGVLASITRRCLSTLPLCIGLEHLLTELVVLAMTTVVGAWLSVVWVVGEIMFFLHGSDRIWWILSCFGVWYGLPSQWVVLDCNMGLGFEQCMVQ